MIDDNPDVADSLVMLIESFGAEVRAAYDGASGVEAAAEFRPDIVFIDIRMPGIDGYETARRLRARLGPDTPTLVALTGLGAGQGPKAQPGSRLRHAPHQAGVRRGAGGAVPARAKREAG